MTRLILIRHGETKYNSQKRYCGFSNPPLNRKGISQVKRLSRKLWKLRIHRVYSSDLKRACQSAGLIFGKSPVKKLSGFREINFGKIEGLKYKEVNAKFPGFYARWASDPVGIKFPGGESLREFNKRILDMLSKIVSRNEGKTVAIAAHAGPIRVILCKALKLDLTEFWKKECANGSCFVVDFLEGKAVKVSEVS
jgi:broad specificity phosphatase PhoE